MNRGPAKSTPEKVLPQLEKMHGSGGHYRIVLRTFYRHGSDKWYFLQSFFLSKSRTLIVSRLGSLVHRCVELFHLPYCRSVVWGDDLCRGMLDVLLRMELLHSVILPWHLNMLASSSKSQLLLPVHKVFVGDWDSISIIQGSSADTSSDWRQF